MTLDQDILLLTKTIRKTKNTKQLSALLDDLLTEEEILDLAQRIKIAKLIISGKTYEEISEKIQASTSTITKIGQVIKFGKGGLEKVLK